MYRVFSNQSPDSNSSDDKNLSVQELKFEKYQIMVLLIININQHKKKRKNIKFFGKFSKQPIRLKTKENLFVLNRYKNQLGDVSNKKTNVELSQKLMSIYKESDNQYRMKKCQLSNLQIQQYKKQIHNIKIITNPNTNIIGKNVNFQSSKYNSIKRKVWHTTKPQLTLFYLQKLPTTYNYQSTFSDYSQNNNTQILYRQLQTGFRTIVQNYLNIKYTYTCIFNRNICMYYIIHILTIIQQVQYQSIMYQQ
eukprot:TRINITY_DN2718_c0_g1_i11.p1 TRINITY_DN2718_c0_g1~~TRINITY_DN2718_c0_g1_i11.p1  ORF type:complete len:250 (+),score=-23.47 TRINITY_DN2718_c0_g1_i11:384-1133(+)